MPTRSTTTSTCSRTSRTSSTTPSTAISSSSSTSARSRAATSRTRSATTTRTHTFGAMLRYDDIGDVGLFRTRSARTPVDRARATASTSSRSASTTRTRRAGPTGCAATLGVRADHYDFDVDERPRRRTPGTPSDSLFAPKASLIYTVDDDTELYVSAGKGFHSNDARGTTITVDPVTRRPGRARRPARRLARARARLPHVRRAQAQRVGRAVAARARLRAAVHRRRRQHRGEPAEPPLRHRGAALLPADRPADVRRRARVDAAREFTELDPAGDEIPGSIDACSRPASRSQNPHGFYGSARLRYFGPRPLIEDGSVESDSSTVVNLRARLQARDAIDLRVDVLNVFDSRRRRHHVLLRVAAARRAGRGRRGPCTSIRSSRATVRAYASWKF